MKFDGKERRNILTFTFCYREQRCGVKKVRYNRFSVPYLCVGALTSMMGVAHKFYALSLLSNFIMFFIL